ncbi:MAG: tyrosine-type recombinase/integrase [Oribacterium sp.]|jgi:Site-specific recombinase XerD|nr:tyrosine-type recombinase/integrase [Oribacterium sp.]
MKTHELSVVAGELITAMRNDGYSEGFLNNSAWILGLFASYCEKQNVSDISIEDAVLFCKDHFGFDYYNLSANIQHSLRRPLLSLFEFYETGTYLRIHPKSVHTKIPDAFGNIYIEYWETVNKLDLAKSTRKERLWLFAVHFNFIYEKGITTPADIRKEHVYMFLKSHQKKYASATMAGQRTVLREIYDWLYEKQYVSFSGKQVIPLVRRDPRDKILSYYSREEIRQTLSCIDTESRSGKYAYAVVSILAYLGMRAGDIILLKFSNIDWENNIINISQQKTGKPLSLPLLDEVKYPLLDYIKNARPKSKDEDYVFATAKAPYTRLQSTGSIYRIVTRCMNIAGIEFEGRHHGSHALRHSLASDLLQNDVPISAIAGILGHSSTKATEAYLTIDETHLKELTLEVPNE